MLGFLLGWKLQLFPKSFSVKFPQGKFICKLKRTCWGTNLDGTNDELVLLC